MNGNPTVTATLMGLIVGGAGVVAAGVMLARSGDVLAARTRLGGLWFGMVFLAFATSLPELVTAATAVRIGAPDLAAGDLFGSNMANMALLALLNLLPGAAVFQRAALDQSLAASHAISMTSIAAAFVLIGPPPLFGWIGLGPVILLMAYLAGTRAIFMHSATAREAVAEAETVEAPTTRAGWTTRAAAGRFLLGMAIVAVAAPLFAISADGVVRLTGLHESFVGAVVLAVATSLPEFVASLAAIRTGAYDLAVANLFGSNAINMVMLAPLDLLHTSGTLLSSISDVHAFAALASVVMMSLAFGAIVFRTERRIMSLEPSSALIVLVYFLTLAVLYGWSG